MGGFQRWQLNWFCLGGDKGRVSNCTLTGRKTPVGKKINQTGRQKGVDRDKNFLTRSL